MLEHKIKRTAWGLSVAGLIPFLWFTLETTLGTTWLSDTPQQVLHGYAAIILSFLGGMVWMRGLTLQGNAQLSQWLLFIAVAPSIAGLSALMLDAQSASLLFILAFGAQIGIERALLGMALIPSWFITLRICITSIVILLLLIAWAFS